MFASLLHCLRSFVAIGVLVCNVCFGACFRPVALFLARSSQQRATIRQTEHENKSSKSTETV